MNNIFTIPPKMLQQLAERARNGEADYYETPRHGPAWCMFYQGNNDIVMMDWDGNSPMATGERINQRRVADRKYKPGHPKLMEQK